MSWNGYPKRVHNSVIKRLEKNRLRPRLADNDDRKKIQLDLSYNEKLGEKLVTPLIKKFKRYFNKNVNIFVKYGTNELFLFYPTKDRIKKEMSYTSFNVLVATMITLVKRTEI